MNYKIICDSGASLFYMNNASYESIPLKVITNTKQYTDSDNINIEEVLKNIDSSNEKSSTSCPNVNDYLNAFKDFDHIFVVTLTSSLSGSYNAAITASNMVTNKKIYIVDSLSAGPSMQLIAEKILELINKNLEFEEICREIEIYKNKIHLLFNLKSLTNLSKNGRISPKVAKIASLMKISIIGSSDKEGKIVCTDKSRGDKNAMKKIFKNMKLMKYNGGKIKIIHCNNPETANYLKELILDEFNPVCIDISIASLICSYYGQLGTVMIAFESGDNLD